MYQVKLKIKSLVASLLIAYFSYQQKLIFLFKLHEKMAFLGVKNTKIQNY